MRETKNTIIWEAEAVVKAEFRLYYDEAGRVLFYTCDKPDGNYIVIDAATFAQGRPDIRVIDGKISTVSRGSIVSRLAPGSDGLACAFDDISVIVDDTYPDMIIHWKLKTYEL